MLLLAPPPPPPPMILTGATLWAEDRAQEGQALLIQRGRIAALGTEAELRRRAPKAAVVKLEGGTLLPGFIEGHAHVEGLGKLAETVDLTGVASPQECLARVAAWTLRNSEGWITGRGWDQNLWPGKAFPTAEQLDAHTRSRPAFLRRVDGHAGWANSAALKAAGITAETPDPEGGRIVRDAQGQPTGILIDRAMDRVEALVPAPSAAQRERWIQAGLLRLRALGFTAVCDMGGDAVTLSAYRRLEAANALPIRVFSYFDWDPKVAEAELKKPRGPLGLLQVQGAKFYFDGALGSRGARLLAPYADAPDTQGLWVMEPTSIGANARTVLKAGYQPAAHAIGDGANAAALEVLGTAWRGSGARLKPRVEHAQIVAPGDARAFGAAGLVASVQPMHLADDHAWTPARLGPERVERAFPWRTLQEGGAPLVFGSDAPIADANPFRALAAAETRQNDAGSPDGGFNPGHALTRAEALRAYTSTSAEVLGHRDLGVIRTGAVADLLWVQAPIHTLTPAQLRTLTPGRLWVNGRETGSAQ